MSCQPAAFTGVSLANDVVLAPAHSAEKLIVGSQLLRSPHLPDVAIRALEFRAGKLTLFVMLNLHECRAVVLRLELTRADTSIQASGVEQLAARLLPHVRWTGC